MSSENGSEPAPSPACRPVVDHSAAELARLLFCAEHALRSLLDDIAVEHGMNDSRDVLVLEHIAGHTPRSQLEIATRLRIDKTTLVAVLDRLAEKLFITRENTARDRRVRVPTITRQGRQALDEVDLARQAAFSPYFAGLRDSDRIAVRSLLAHISAPVDST